MGEPEVMEAIRTRDGAFLGLRPDGINPRGGAIVERIWT
jgi:hypothetical protein